MYSTDRRIQTAPDIPLINPQQSLQIILQTIHKGYAYQVLELQMSIQMDSKSVGKSKIDDISQLIQLYMIGVQALEGADDARFAYFNKKLQQLMLKRSVMSQLYTAKGISKKDTLMSPKNKQQKRKQHEIILFYNKDQHQKQKVKQIVENVQGKLKSYEGLINGHIKQQQDKIKQRIQLRKMKSQTGSVKKLNLNQIQQKYNKMLKNNAQTPNRAKHNQVFFDQDLKYKNTFTGQKHQSRNLVTTHRHNF